MIFKRLIDFFLEHFRSQHGHPKNEIVKKGKFAIAGLPLAGECSPAPECH